MDNSANLLLVDDNPENLRVVNFILKGEGYKIAMALNGGSALEILDEIDIDLILLDILMPNMDGYEVCRLIKENSKWKDIPVIFVSALNCQEDIVKGFNAGGVDYITKPFQAEEVKARVATHVKIRKQNEELKKLNADKDRFVSILSHDLKSPLGGLLGYLDLLLANIYKYNASEVEQKLGTLNNYAKSLYALLEDSLQWAGMQTGKFTFTPQLVSFNAIYYAVLGSVKSIADAKNISIELNQPVVTEIYADKNMITAVLRNLISNSIKFTNNGGFVKVSALKSDFGYIISVTDNGVGMNPETIKTLFDITQVRSTPGTAAEKGTGLGLLLCKEFIEKHSGKITVESEVGRGAEFKVIIPFAK
jgi:two-component system, sensor histidine kinase and response regulator